jgi:hypothetical protein
MNRLFDVVIKRGNGRIGIYVATPNESVACRIAGKMGRSVLACYEMDSDFAENPESLRGLLSTGITGIAWYCKPRPTLDEILSGKANLIRKQWYIVKEVKA